ncbi:GNAT family N-acetyltransferase [Phenylobacterium sp.]|uniref:GNAT family N-acetyltransferase n=1 Tax=Phenylobacterium sp. TaxID=1871053 RepID=UPI00286E143E|nr:GNAT family N-acetyltransferase [Phenylobacterium sp.]
MAFRIETKPSVIQGLVADIRAAADTDKEALGFLPASAYDQAARKGELTVALQDGPDGRTYAGHIWVSGLFPHARVVQLFVAPAVRGQKLSTRLLRAAIQSAEASGFQTIFAKVAADLAANRVYEHHGFVVVRTKAGGKARNRQIQIRSRELSTPTLFNYRPTSVVAIDDGGSTQSGQQLYLIDLNVFFDATRQRRFTPAAEKILASALNSGVRLAVTTEFVKELQRTTVGKDDPVLSFAKKLPTVSGPSRPEIESLATRLAPTVFPDQWRDGTLSTNDHSDLRHLAEAILAGAAGFVTGETGVLRAHAALREQHGLNVWSTEDFATFLTPVLADLPVAGHAEHDLAFTEEKSLSAEAVTFLKTHGTADSVIWAFSRLDTADKRFRYLAAREAQALIAFAACRAAPGPADAVGLLLVADPRHPATPTALDFLLEHAVRAASLSRPSRVEMAHVDGQSVARIAAIENGFLATRAGVDASLRKIAVGTAVTPFNWTALRDRIQKGTGLTLPADCPNFRDDEQEIAVTLDGRAATLPLASLESLAAPGLFLLKDRPVAVVPIRRAWAEDLVGGPQLSFLPKPEAAFRSRRVYFASVRNQHILVKGRLIILYESGKDGGRGAAIAVARVASAEAVPKAHAPDSLMRAAVVRGGDLQDLVKGTTVLAVWFDNIMRFENPVSFHRMKALGLVDPTNLIKSHMLKFETAVKILDAGRPDAR